MKIATASGNFCFTCRAPCTSISSTRSIPSRRASSTHLRGVPYQCLPNTGHTREIRPAATRRSNSASEMKS